MLVYTLLIYFNSEEVPENANSIPVYGLNSDYANFGKKLLFKVKLFIK